MVDSKLLSFFQPAAEKVMSSADPTAAMAAALAALSGIKEIPKPRSLLAQVRPVFHCDRTHMSCLLARCCLLLCGRTCAGGMFRRHRQSCKPADTVVL